MAKGKAKLASSKPVSTTWLNNAMRSIGISTKNVIKSEFPNIYETVDTGINASKSVINTLRRNAGGANQISQHLQNNKYVKFAQTAYKNALNDLRTGNLNNEERAANAMFGDSGDGNIDTLFEYGAFENAFDGNYETYAWFDYNNKEGGAVFTLDLGEVKEVNNIDVVMGQHDEHTDYLHHYELLVSEDGNSWTPIGEYLDTRVLNLKLETSVSARYVKVHALDYDLLCNIVIREIAAY